MIKFDTHNLNKQSNGLKLHLHYLSSLTKIFVDNNLKTTKTINLRQSYTVAPKIKMMTFYIQIIWINIQTPRLYFHYLNSFAHIRWDNNFETNEIIYIGTFNYSKLNLY